MISKEWERIGSLTIEYAERERARDLEMKLSPNTKRRYLICRAKSLRGLIYKGLDKNGRLSTVIYYISLCSQNE